MYLYTGLSTFKCVLHSRIEHLEAPMLSQLPSSLFGALNPKVVVLTTPNADFNVLFPDLTGFRHWDHKFEWSRIEFKSWYDLYVWKHICVCGLLHDIVKYSYTCTENRHFGNNHMTITLCPIPNNKCFGNLITCQYILSHIQSNIIHIA